eukprot:scaffold3419_cov142-Amphora_coffeaeformis.AAC.3
MDNLSANDVRRLGLIAAKISVIEQNENGVPQSDKMFRALYGSPPECLADQWEDLCLTNTAARLTDRDKTPHGFKMFCMAHYVLWTYPRNSTLLQVHFSPIGEKWTRGAPLWHKIVWVNGPFIAGKTDLTIFRDGQSDGTGSLLDRLQNGKMVIADRGYQTSRADEVNKVAFKRNEDPAALKKFKARALCRHETVNGRIKEYKCLSETFRHTDAQHGLAFKAVCSITLMQTKDTALLALSHLYSLATNSSICKQIMTAHRNINNNRLAVVSIVSTVGFQGSSGKSKAL